MNLTKHEFEILRTLAEGELETAPATLEAASLTASGFLLDGQITEAGLAALEPYRVKRMIIIAAGYGSRLRPITINTPKPLVRVHGQRIIDSLLDAAVAAGIEDIVLVRGYLGEQFDQLTKKYPQLRFVENPAYAEANNISSVDRVRELLPGAYVAEADLLYWQPRLVTKYQYESNYLGAATEHTDDWCFHVDEDGYIREIGIGGDHCFHMFGLSWWTEADGARLAEDIHAAFADPAGKKFYWDEVAMKLHAGEYRVAVRPCTFDDIIEIDTFAELKALDTAYAEET